MPKKLPYHDAKWLRRELKKHRSIGVLCRVHNFRPASVIDYLRRHPEVKAAVADLISPPPALRRPGPSGGGAPATRLASLRRHKRDWTLAELEAQSLPLYWDHGWLLEQLRLHRSLEEVARAHGYKTFSLQSYVLRHPELRQAVEELRLERRDKQRGIHLRMPEALYEQFERRLQAQAGPKSKVSLLAKAIRRKIDKIKKEAQHAKKQP